MANDKLTNTPGNDCLGRAILSLSQLATSTTKCPRSTIEIICRAQRSAIAKWGRK